MAALRFDVWMDQVDDSLFAMTDGMIGTQDLPDADYFGWFDDGYTPKQAAKRIYKEEISVFKF